MKRLTIAIVLILAVFAAAEVHTFYWMHPTCGMMRTMTSDPNHIALMEAWMVKKCKMEKPVRQAYTTEEWKALTPEERQAAHALKRTRTIVTDPNTGETTGDGMDYTVLAESPIQHFNDDPNDVIDLNEVK